MFATSDVSSCWLVSMQRIGETNRFKELEQNMQLDGFDRITAGGFTQVPNVIQNDPNLELGEKAVYAQFLQYAWHHNYCFPSQEKIASNLGLSQSRVSEFVKGLERKGYLAIERRGLGKTNFYTLHATIKKPRP
jgi:biotin operon repressor